MAIWKIRTEKHIKTGIVQWSISRSWWFWHLIRRGSPKEMESPTAHNNESSRHIDGCPFGAKLRDIFVWILQKVWNGFEEKHKKERVSPNYHIVQGALKTEQHANILIFYNKSFCKIRVKLDQIFIPCFCLLFWGSGMTIF